MPVLSARGSRKSREKAGPGRHGRSDSAKREPGTELRCRSGGDDGGDRLVRPMQQADFD